VRVQHPTGLSYYWNTQSSETTALGEAAPTHLGRAVGTPAPGLGPATGAGPAGSPLFQLVGYPLALGLGMGLVFGLVRMLF
jgi:hypothetical protein